MAELGYVAGVLIVLVLGALLLAFVAAVLWTVYGAVRWVARCTAWTAGATCAALEHTARRLL